VFAWLAPILRDRGVDGGTAGLIVSVSIVLQLNRVLSSGLLSFRCEMAQKFSGYPVSCQWFANVPPGQHEAAAAELRSLRTVRLSASTTGSTNFVIVMWLHSLADVMNAELALQQRIPQIELVESVVILNTAKRVGWMLNPDSTASGAVVVSGILEA